MACESARVYRDADVDCINTRLEFEFIEHILPKLNITHDRKTPIVGACYPILPTSPELGFDADQIWPKELAALDVDQSRLLLIEQWFKILRRKQ
jgi:hypothetical protein